jgi:hypothetical protein
MVEEREEVSRITTNDQACAAASAKNFENLFVDDFMRTCKMVLLR